MTVHTIIQYDNTELVQEIKKEMQVPSRGKAWVIDNSPENGFIITRNTEYDNPESGRDTVVDNGETVTLYCKTVYDGKTYYHVPLRVTKEDKYYKVVRMIDYDTKSTTESFEDTVEFFCEKIWSELRQGYYHHEYRDNHYLDRREDEEKLLENML